MRVLRIAVLLLLVSTFTLAGVGPSGADEGQPDVERALEEYKEKFLPTLDAMADVRTSEAALASREVERDGAVELEEQSARTLIDTRARFSKLAVGAYKDRGSRSADLGESAENGIALLSARLRLDARNHEVAGHAADEAERNVDRAVRQLEKSRSALEATESDLTNVEAELEDHIRIHAPTLPGYAFASARMASDRLEEGVGCSVPPALLAGVSRILTDHGRALDRPIAPSGRTITLDGPSGLHPEEPDRIRIGVLQLDLETWSHAPVVAEGPSMSPDLLFTSLLVAGNLLCAGSHDLTSDTGMHRALVDLTGNASMARAIMGSARHLSRSTELRLGQLPPDPRQIAALERLTVDGTIEEGVNPRDFLLAWSRLRLGTPYSQCLGADARPEDPECPPGTNRFGNGFFDCSGFVSAAYAALGISIPTTTDSMLFDDDFARFFSSSTFDPQDDVAGDVLLMDGHVALSTGEGTIIHASGGELVEEPLPLWVRNGILGVYRLLSA